MAIDIISSTDALAGAVICLATVVGVNPDTRTVDVTTRYPPFLTKSAIKYSTPVIHGAYGTGIDFVPDVDSLCYICMPADGSGTFVFAFVVGGESSPEGSTSMLKGSGEKSYSANRPRMDPGDIGCTGPDGNFLFVRRGGLVEIGASTTCRTMYIPVESIIRSYFAKYHAFSPLGELVWDHAQITNQDVTDGGASDTPVMLKLSCRDKLQDRKMAVEIRMGRLSQDMLDAALDSNLLREGMTTSVDVVGESQEIDVEELESGAGDREHMFAAARQHDGVGLQSHDPGDDSTPMGEFSFVITQENGDTGYVFQVSRSGDFFIRNESHIHIETDKGFYLRAGDEGVLIETEKGKLTLKEFIKLEVLTGMVQLLENGDVTIMGNNITLAATGVLSLGGAAGISFGGAGGAPVSVLEFNANEVRFGKDANMDLLANSTSWRDAVDNHQHLSTTAGLPTGPIGPPTVPVQIRITEGGVSTSQTSTKLFVKG